MQEYEILIDTIVHHTIVFEEIYVVLRELYPVPDDYDPVFMNAKLFFALGQVLGLASRELKTFGKDKELIRALSEGKSKTVPSSSTTDGA